MICFSHKQTYGKRPSNTESMGRSTEDVENDSVKGVGARSGRKKKRLLLPAQFFVGAHASVVLIIITVINRSPPRLGSLR